MAKKADKNQTSFGFWMFALFIMAIPCIGVIMTIVWAFFGGNESRKNYFHALIVWFLILSLVMSATAMMMGWWPQIEKQFHLWMQTLFPAKPGS